MSLSTKCLYSTNLTNGKISILAKNVIIDLFKINQDN